jgi:hypothetical protein
MDKQVHELTWELKRLQLVVDRALDSVRPLRQASDPMLREYRVSLVTAPLGAYHLGCLTHTPIMTSKILALPRELISGTWPS